MVHVWERDVGKGDLHVKHPSLQKKEVALGICLLCLECPGDRFSHQDANPLRFGDGRNTVICCQEGPISQFRDLITTEMSFLQKSNLSFTFAQISQQLRAFFQSVKRPRMLREVTLRRPILPFDLRVGTIRCGEEPQPRYPPG